MGRTNSFGPIIRLLARTPMDVHACWEARRHAEPSIDLPFTHVLRFLRQRRTSITHCSQLCKPRYEKPRFGATSCVRGQRILENTLADQTRRMFERLPRSALSLLKHISAFNILQNQCTFKQNSKLPCTLKLTECRQLALKVLATQDVRGGLSRLSWEHHQ